MRIGMILKTAGENTILDRMNFTSWVTSTRGFSSKLLWGLQRKSAHFRENCARTFLIWLAHVHIKVGLGLSVIFQSKHWMKYNDQISGNSDYAYHIALYCKILVSAPCNWRLETGHYCSFKYQKTLDFTIRLWYSQNVFSELSALTPLFWIALSNEQSSVAVCTSGRVTNIFTIMIPTNRPTYKLRPCIPVTRCADALGITLEDHHAGMKIPQVNLCLFLVRPIVFTSFLP